MYHRRVLNSGSLNISPPPLRTSSSFSWYGPLLVRVRQAKAQAGNHREGSNQHGTISEPPNTDDRFATCTTTSPHPTLTKPTSPQSSGGLVLTFLRDEAPRVLDWIQIRNQVCWYSDNPPHLYSGGVRFESRPGYLPASVGLLNLLQNLL